jgi:hypothetical protein
MEKWVNTFYSDFLEGERMNCYWFWFKGKITRKRNKETGEVYEQNLSGTLEWNGIRLKNGFYNCFNILTEKYMSGKYNGQTKTEFAKNFKRVKDIVDKSAGDVDKASKLAQTQANRITDEWKAINRAMAAKQTPYLKNQEYEIYETIFEAFFHRAYELGSVNKQDYREYQLEKLGL